MTINHQIATIDAQQQRLPFNVGLSGSSGDYAFDTSKVLLNTLDDVCAVCAVPVLSHTARLVLGILNAVKVMAVTDNCDMWVQLADDAAKLVVALAQELKYKTIEISSLDSLVISHLKELHGVIEEIDANVSKKTSQSLVRRVMSFRSDEQRVKGWKIKLNHFIDVFEVRLAITNEALLADIVAKQDVFLRGQHNLLSLQGSVAESQRETLKILQKLESLQDPSSVGGPGVSAPESSTNSPVRFDLSASPQDPSPLTQTPLNGSTTPSPVLRPGCQSSPSETSQTRRSNLASATPVIVISGDKIENTNNSVAEEISRNTTALNFASGTLAAGKLKAVEPPQILFLINGAPFSVLVSPPSPSAKYMCNSEGSSPSRNRSVDAVLDISSVLLTTLNDVSAVCAVPFLGNAAQLALGILNTVQAVKDNRDAWVQLADDAAKLVVALAREVKYKTVDASLMGPEMTSHLEELHRVLQEIDAFAKKKTSQSLAKRVMLFRGDEQKVKEWRGKLNHSMDVFGVRAAITNAALLADVEAKQDDLLIGQNDLLSRQGDVIESQQEALQILRKLESLQTISLVESPASSPISAAPSSRPGSPSMHNSTPLVQSPIRSHPSSPTSVSPPIAQQSPPEAPPSPQSLLSAFEGILPSAASITIISGNQIENTNNSVVNVTNAYNTNVKNVNNSGNWRSSTTSSRGSNRSGIPRGRRYKTD
ncbi:hypothetical protein ONZ45_g11985 [Pleurotus djamor]|nr:hypothetical protein ONZ45_g11985 [Pleurotus djamor]